jgi:hypothetical protein
MIARRLGGAIAMTMGLVIGLSGCALATPSGGDEPLSGIAQCALGKTWKLDMSAIAEQIKANLVKKGIAVSNVVAEGDQTFSWTIDGRVDVATDYTVTVTSSPAADQVVVVTSTHNGPMTGKAYINGEVAIPRDWDATGLDVKTKATLGGQPLDPVPFALPKTDIDDAVGLELTCDGGTLTTHPRGTDITQTWTS